MSVKQQCPICGTKDVEAGRSASTHGGWQDGAWVICPQCGKFKITDDAHSQIQRRDIDRRLVSAWIREQNDQGVKVAIETGDADRLAALPFPTFKERIEGFLLAVAKRSPSLASEWDYAEPTLRAYAYCTGSEIALVRKHLQSEGYMVVPDGSSRGRLTPKGHMYADELRTKRAASSQGFIAMWFAEEMEPARREGFEPGVRNAGYKPHRVDDAQHIDKIDDRIIAEIRRSKFVVADLTGHRGGVYYEAGFALGLGKPVFYTCRQDHKDAIHFDIRQFNCIIWSDPQELAATLQVRIEAVLGAGPESVR